MKNYDVHLRKNETGEVRIVSQQWDDVEHGDDVFAYLWIEGGNYSCDCNRALFFARAANEGEPEVQCGESAFTIVKVIDHDTGAEAFKEDLWERVN